MLLPLLPAGIGPRDAVLVVGLAGVTGAAAAASLALALRVVSFAGELVAVAVAELAALRARAPRAVRRRRGASPLRRPSHARPRRPRAPTRARSSSCRPTTSARRCRCSSSASRATGLDLLIVDDSSPDGTGELADALAAERPWMHVMHRAEKDGLGMAYRAGFAWCLAEGYERHRPDGLRPLAPAREARRDARAC